MASWNDPAESAAEWLEHATMPWKEGVYEPGADLLLLAAQVAALLAIDQQLSRLVRKER